MSAAGRRPLPRRVLAALGVLAVLGILAAHGARAADPSGSAARAGKASERAKGSADRGKRPPRRDEDAPPLVEQRLEVEPLAIVGGHVHPVTSPDVVGGVVLLRGGRVEAVLPASRAEEDWAARGYEVLDAAGRHVYPGLVVAGSDGLGLNFDAWQVGSGDDALGRRVADSFNAWADDLELAASAGITTALVYRVPFSPKGALAGRAALLKTSYGEPRGALLRERAAVLASARALAPDQRASLRRLVEKTREAGPPDEDDEAAQLLHALARRDVPLYVAADAAGDVAAVLDLVEELDLRVVLYLPTEAWALADESAAARSVSVVQHVRTSWFKPRGSRRSVHPGGWRFDAATRLHRAGVPVAVGMLQDVPSTMGIAGRDLVNFPVEAAFAQRAGLSAAEALEAITIVPARILGVEDRIGSLEKGKDADVIVTDGDVLDYRTFVRCTIVNGRVAYRAEGNRWWKWCIERRDRALASGSSRPPEPAARDGGTRTGRR